MSQSICMSRKVVIVGAGDVGATFAYALAQSGVAEEIVLIDLNREHAEGQVMDLAHGLAYLPPVRIRAGDKADYADADVIVITAGSRSGPGETRLQLLRLNATIIQRIMDEITQQSSRGIVIMVSNPVDVLTRIAIQRSGWPNGRIMGSGTVLDSARFRYLLSLRCGINVRNIHAYILGEHGDSEIAAWSMTHLAGVSMDVRCPMCDPQQSPQVCRSDLIEEVRTSAYHVIEYKGSTCYAVGLALVRIVEAILRDERSVLTVSIPLTGEFGIRDTCLSVPCVVSRAGVDRILEGPLTEQEIAGLRHSADVLDKAYEETMSV